MLLSQYDDKPMIHFEGSIRDEESWESRGLLLNLVQVSKMGLLVSDCTIESRRRELNVRISRNNAIYEN